MVAFGHRHSMELPAEHRSAHEAGAAHEKVFDASGREALAELARRLDASRAAMEQRLAHHVEAETARHGEPVHLVSRLLIPERVWRGRHGKFLLHTLALAPYDAWNVLISPADARSAALTETPEPPAADEADAIEICNEKIAEARQRYADALDLTDWSNDHKEVERMRLQGRDAMHDLAMALRDSLLHRPHRAA